MKLNDQVSGLAPSSMSLRCGPLTELYQNVLLQFQATKRQRKFGNLWSRVAPAGSIYRYIGLSQERLKHCLDIDHQLREIAEERKALLGDDVSLADRVERLMTALHGMKPTCHVFESETQGMPEGFLPIEEFRDEGIVCTAGIIIHPAEPAARSKWFFYHVLALVVFMIQVFGPLLAVVQLWGQNDNHVKDLRKLWTEIHVKEMLCVGGDRTSLFSSIMGVLFLFMVNIMIYHHCKHEYADSKKMGRIPVDDFWRVLGFIAQFMCSLTVIAAAHLELWTEKEMTGIMMNSMALLFVFSLDDLAGGVFEYIGEDDKDFQKQVAWTYALLAYCPVDLRDLIDTTATKREDIWKISYDVEGRLLSVRSEICETRVMAETPPATESSHLTKKGHSEMTVKYRVGPRSKTCHLPDAREKIICMVWYVTKRLLSVLSMILPIIWFVCNKPCKFKKI